MNRNRAPASESVYVLQHDASPEAITSSLLTLLPARRHPIGRRRFTLLDTFDGRIRRAGARLTEEAIDGASAVVWQGGLGGGRRLDVRMDRPPSFIWDLPDGPLRRTAAPIIGVRRLLPQADAEEYGTQLEIVDDRDKTVARLRIESALARLPLGRSDWTRLPTVVTVTGLRGYEEVRERLVSIVESRPGVQACPEGPDSFMLRQLGVPERCDISSPRVELAPTVRADVGARQIHRALLGVLAATEPGLRANLDTEFLHDFRVAVRRTRSLLGQIRHVFPPESVGHFSSEFSWIGRLTGPPRDLDVLVLGLREQRAEFPDGDVDALVALLACAQQREHIALLHALDSDRYRRLLADWASFLDQPAPARPDARNAGRLLRDVVARRAWRLSRRIVKRAGNIDESTAAEEIHEVRIAAKKLRYLIDVTPAFFDAADLECILDSLKRLQRVLGDFNDAHVQEKQFVDSARQLAASGAPADVLFALGRLAERSRHRGDEVRRQVVERLARFRGKQTRSACRRAFATR